MRSLRSTRTTPTRLWLALLIGALVAAGCGGDDSDDGAGSDTDAATETSDETADEPAPSDDEPDEADETAEDATDDEGATDDTGSNGGGGDAAAGTATVTIGDTTYVGTQEIVCITLGGAIGGSWNDDTGEISISIDLPPPDWEDNPDDWTPPSVRVDDDSDPNAPRQFQASAEMATMLNLPNAEASVVSSYSIDGSSGSGSAVFVEFFESMAALSSGEDPPAPVEGTFTLSCS